MKEYLLDPVPPGERIFSLDLLRGVAVLGILIMNIQHFSMPAAAYINPTAYGDLSGWNKWVWIIGHMLASGKFMSIFSMLFGAGILLFTRRAEIRGYNSALLHYRRMGWLLLFGVLHAYLIWSGDILVSYSLCGMLVFLFRRKQASALLGLAFAFFLIPVFLNFLFAGTISIWPEESRQMTMESWSPGAEKTKHILEAYRSGWPGQMKVRVPEALFMETGYFLMGPFWRVTALMLLGMALLEQGILSCERSSRFYRRMMFGGLVSGFLLSGLGVYLNFLRGWTMEFSMFTGSQFNYLGSLGVALGYTGGLMLIAKSMKLLGFKRILSAVGRMAFTNYIFMSLICTLIFYGHGLGFFGSVERKYQVLIVLAVWALLLVISPLWLRTHRFGPLEQLWRKLTYLNIKKT